MISKVTLFNITFVYYAIFAFILSFLLKLLGYIYKKYGKKTAYRITRVFSFLIIAPVFVYGIFWLDAVFIEPNWIQVTKISVKARNFGSRLKDVRIVQISDLHIEKVGYREKKLVEIVNRLKPDILFITGDFLSSASGLRPAIEILRSLRAEKGIYAILGNHDYYYLKEKDVVDALQGIGIRVLKYDNLKLDLGENGSFWLIGLSDKYGLEARYGNELYIKTAFKDVPSDEAKVMLIHDPDVSDLKIISQYKPQLILAGHTHGGQVGIPFIRKFSWYAERSKYMAGLFKVNDIPLYVNRGIGMITRKMRLFDRPEVTIIRLLKG